MLSSFLDVLAGLRRSPRGAFHRRCNFCGAERFRVWKRLPKVRFPERIYGDHALSDPSIGRRLALQYLSCARCGLIGVNPLPRFADVDKRSFDGERNIVAWVDVGWDEYESGKREVIRIVHQQYRFESYRSLGRVLDVSCGPGVSLAWLRDQHGWEVRGVDPDRHSVRLAAERFGLEVANGLIRDVAEPAESFDLVLMDNSLEHTFDPLSALLDAFRLLRKGGGLFVFVPNADGLSTLHLNDNVHWGHWFLYSAPVLVRLLERIGFRVVRLIGIQNPINPRLAEAGVDAEAQLAALRIDLRGADAVRAGLDATPLRADYFNLLAEKPADAGVASPREDELRAIAAASCEELARVSIERGPAAGTLATPGPACQNGRTE